MIRMAAIISGGDFRNRRGLTNVALKRIELLEQNPDYSVDIFGISIDYRKLTFRGLFKGEFEKNTISLGGHTIKMLIKVEYSSNCRLLRKPLKLYHRFLRHRNSDWEWHKRFANVFKGYDAITAHFNDAAIVAESAYRKYGIPYFVTWHGSDIHTIPFRDDVAKEKTIKAIECASCNFFVSRALLDMSDSLTPRGRKEVLYNGVDHEFVRFSEHERACCRAAVGLTDEKVVTYAGNLKPIKNADMLPDIFAEIKKLYSGSVTFWIVGDGELGSVIKDKLHVMKVPCRMFGSQPFEYMPIIYNCTDVLVLPSQNEGMPLVTIEAISCGASVVASNVGGIKESIGEDNCVPLSDTFVSDIAAKVVQKLNAPDACLLDECFTWEYSSRIEEKLYREILL